MVVRIATLAAVVVGISLGGYKLGSATSRRLAAGSVVPPTVSIPKDHALSVALHDSHTTDDERDQLEQAAAQLGEEQDRVQEAINQASDQRAKQDDATIAAEQAALKQQLAALEAERKAILDKLNELSVARADGKDSRMSEALRKAIERSLAATESLDATKIGAGQNALMTDEMRKNIERAMAEASKAMDSARSDAMRAKIAHSMRDGKMTDETRKQIERAMAEAGNAMKSANSDEMRAKIEAALSQMRKSMGKEGADSTSAEAAMKQALKAMKDAKGGMTDQALEQAMEEAKFAQNEALVSGLEKSHDESVRAARMQLDELRSTMKAQKSEVERELSAARSELRSTAQLRKQFDRSMLDRETEAQTRLLSAYNASTLSRMDKLERARVVRDSQLHTTLETSRGFALTVALTLRNELGLTPHQTTQLELLQADFLKEFAPIREQYEMLTRRAMKFGGSVNPQDDVQTLLLTSAGRNAGQESLEAALPLALSGASNVAYATLETAALAPAQIETDDEVVLNAPILNVQATAALDDVDLVENVEPTALAFTSAITGLADVQLADDGQDVQLDFNGSQAKGDRSFDVQAIADPTDQTVVVDGQSESQPIRYITQEATQTIGGEGVQQVTVYGQGNQPDQTITIRIDKSGKVTVENSKESGKRQTIRYGSAHRSPKAVTVTATNGQIVIKGPDGRTQTIQLEPGQRITSVKDPNDASKTVQVVVSGGFATMKDPTGRTQTIQLGPGQRVTSVKDPNDTTKTMEVIVSGKPTILADGLSQTIKSEIVLENGDKSLTLVNPDSNAKLLKLLKPDEHTISLSSDAITLGKNGIGTQIRLSNRSQGSGWTRVVPRSSANTPKGAVVVDDDTFAKLVKLNGGNKRVYIQVSGSSNGTSGLPQFQQWSNYNKFFSSPNSGSWNAQDNTFYNVKQGDAFKLWTSTAKNGKGQSWSFPNDKYQTFTYEPAKGKYGPFTGRVKNGQPFVFTTPGTKYITVPEVYFATPMHIGGGKQDAQRAHLENELSHLESKYTNRTMKVLTEAQRRKLRQLIAEGRG